MAHIVVAGGAGFLGSHLCRRLVADGHRVAAIDNLSTGSKANIADLLDHPAFSFIEQNVTRAPQLAADCVIHLASPASPIDYDRLPLETMEANSLGTWRLLEVARAAGASFVFASTSEVYGDPLVHPQPEDYWGNVSSIGPRASYDESKRFGEALVMSFRRVHGVRAYICRLFNTYGPGMQRNDGRAIPELINAALENRPLQVHGDGSQTRSFCYVSDMVDGLTSIINDRELDGQVLNIGNPEEISVKQLAQKIAHLTGTTASIAPGPRRLEDPKRRRPVIAKMIARYAWWPRVGLDEGLRRTIEWFADPHSSLESSVSAVNPSAARDLVSAKGV